MSQRDEEKYLWITSSAGMKILQEGLEFREIFVPLMDIHDNNPHLSEKLHQICARLEFVERLKLTSTFKIDEHEGKALQYQLDRLITYLTLTCVDIAAGREYRPFQDWIKDELNVPRANVSAMISNLAGSTDANDLKSLLSMWIPKLYYEEYLEKDNEGIGRKFRLFLSEDLTPWLQDWLANVYVIVYGEELPFLSSEPDWFKHDSLSRCKLVAKHLFELRNKFTHTVEYLPPMEDTRWGTWGVIANGNQYKFVRHHKNGDIGSPVVRSVGLKEGVSESDIVRLILVIQMRKWLGINSEPRIIKAYFDRVAYRRLGFDLLMELDINLLILQEWCTEHLMLYHDAPIVKLYNKSAIEFNKLHSEIYPGQCISLGHLDSYIEEVDVINHHVTTFLNSFEKTIGNNWEISQNKWKLLDSLVKTNELRWIVENIYNLKRDLFRRLNESFY